MFFLYAMKKYALIVAGGSGTRMGGKVPKQFLEIHGKPLLWHSIEAFRSAFADIHIVLVLPETYRQDDVPGEILSDKINHVVGGSTRFHSVQNGLAVVPDDAVVFVHDGVRCLLSPNLIQRCYEQALAKGSAIPVVNATDSMRVDKDGSHCTIDRDYIRIVQTPQTFLSHDLKAAFAQPYHGSFTDEASVMEAGGKQVFLIDGEYENIKITRPLDLLIAEAILAQRTKKI